MPEPAELYDGGAGEPGDRSAPILVSPVFLAIVGSVLSRNSARFVSQHWLVAGGGVPCPKARDRERRKKQRSSQHKLFPDRLAREIWQQLDVGGFQAFAQMHWMRRAAYVAIDQKPGTGDQLMDMIVAANAADHIDVRDRTLVHERTTHTSTIRVRKSSSVATSGAPLH